ncbi:LacI family DNA-binding transcriptional regulator [Leifsonia sp. F6_8S_P_1B]|uniref:LacI family DNA-binding transcriptional regulator n=1 Tax=Leifsonia williamsii TaxID=3035919 RepID=A0ABT8K8M0_9MICO|nr:LacI family DNA-binding transcriptional regulator [Leifsonia williamsii]MDN4613808.1 LacI family DNA-binding transcriptional regulator [Leifsonia williamsii]
MPGQRTTATDVAKAAGVSRATVSFVLNATPGQSISDAVRARVLAEASRLGYMPHPQARALASGQSNIVLMVLPEWPIEYVTRQLLDEATVELDEAGYSLVTMDPRRSRRATPLWESLRPDVVMSIDPLAPKVLESIERSGAVVIKHGPEMLPMYRVGPDLQVGHLLNLGHTSIAYAHTPIAAMRDLDQERMSRIRRGAEAAGAAFRSAEVSATNAQEVVRTWSRAGVTAVAAFNDDTAAWTIGGALRSGLRVPDDLAVLGHDDSPIAAMFVPAISTIHLDLAGLGRALAQQALAVARGGAQPDIGDPFSHARLIRRESA